MKGPQNSKDLGLKEKKLWRLLFSTEKFVEFVFLDLLKRGKNFWKSSFVEAKKPKFCLDQTEQSEERKSDSRIKFVEWQENLRNSFFFVEN